MKRIRLNQGFSLIEVLISFVILVIGILGASTLIIRSSQVNMTAYETEQVAIVANNIIEKIRNDPDNAEKYTVEGDRNSSGLSAECSTPDATTSEVRCTAQQLVKLNWSQFKNELDNLKLASKPTDILLDVQEVNPDTTLAGYKENKQFLLIISWGPDGADKKTYTVNFVVTVPAVAVTTP